MKAVYRQITETLRESNRIIEYYEGGWPYKKELEEIQSRVIRKKMN